MPLPTYAEWIDRCRDHGIRLDPGRIYYDIGQTLKISARLSGFYRFQSLGYLHTRIAEEFRRHGAFYRETPGVIVDLMPELMTEIRQLALFVSQNEFGTVGPRGNGQRFIYSTGFFRCIGVVLFDEGSDIATLAHVAPKTDAAMSIQRMSEDFEEEGGGGDDCVAFVFGGRDGDSDVAKRRELLRETGAVAGEVRHVPLSELGVDNGWGFHFDRTTGAYGPIRGTPFPTSVFGQPELTLLDFERRQRNTANDSRRGDAELLPATG